VHLSWLGAVGMIKIESAILLGVKSFILNFPSAACSPCFPFHRRYPSVKVKPPLLVKLVITASPNTLELSRRSVSTSAEQPLRRWLMLRPHRKVVPKTVGITFIISSVALYRGVAVDVSPCLHNTIYLYRWPGQRMNVADSGDSIRFRYPSKAQSTSLAEGRRPFGATSRRQ